APAVNGIATVTANLATQYAAAGHQVVVLAPAFPGSIDEDGKCARGEMRFRSVRLPCYPSARACIGSRFRSQARRFLESFRPSVVHLQTHFFLARAMLRVCAERDIPLLATCHCNSANFLLNIPLLGRIAPRLNRIYWRDAVSVYSQAQRVTAPTRSMAQLLQRHGVTAPVRVIPNGVDTTWFSNQPGPLDEAVRARYRIPPRDALLSVGRLDGDKGVNALIALLGLMAASGEGHLIVCGSGTQEARLRAAARDLRMEQRVSLTGVLPSGELASV